MYNGKVVGYGCVASSQHSVKEDRFLTDEEIKWRKNTKVADEIRKLTDLFLPADCVKIDVVGGSYRRRHYLEKFLRTMSYGDSIVISSLSSLGLNNEELVENYIKIYEKGVGLLLPDYSQKDGLSKYSTTDYAFSPISISEEEFKFLCSELSMTEIKSNRGRKMIGLSDDFKEIYWLYERYLIDPITAIKNKYYSISKNTFRKLADEYEASDEYNNDLEYQEKEFQVSGLPKRHGVIDADVTELIKDVGEHHITFEVACNNYDVTINKIQFHRLLLKYYCKKGGALKKTFELKDYDLIESLQPHYES